MSKLSGAAAERWEVPNTEIVIERMKSGPRSGEFLFSAGTVARAEEFYERVRDCLIRGRSLWSISGK